MFYTLGWLFLFVLILAGVHILSKHVREIVFWILKIWISVSLTLFCFVLVYVFENKHLLAGISARLSRQMNAL